MDLLFHVHHSGDAARVNGDTLILTQWPNSCGVHGSKPNWFLDRLIWDSLRQACRNSNRIWAWDNNGVTYGHFSIGTEVSAFVG